MKSNRSKWNLIPKIIRKDFIRKFVAFLFSCFIWYLVSNKLMNDFEIKNVKIKFIAPDGWAIEEKSNNNPFVSINIEAPKGKVLSAKDFTIEKKILAKNCKEGNIHIEINNNDIKAPSGVKIKSIYKNKKTITLDKRITKSINVIVERDKNSPLSDDYECDFNEISIQPKTIKITGSKKEVNKISEIKTKPIPMDTTESFNILVEIENKNKKIKLSKHKVLVKVEIYKKFSEKTFYKTQNEIEIIKNSAGPFNIEFLNKDSQILVKVAGLRKSLENIPEAEVETFIDCLNINKSGIYDMNIKYKYKLYSKKNLLALEKKSLKFSFYPKKIQIKVTNKNNTEYKKNENN